jgi:hypothetical protein
MSGNAEHGNDGVQTFASRHPAGNAQPPDGTPRPMPALRRPFALMLAAFVILNCVACGDPCSAPVDDDHHRARQLWHRAAITSYSMTQWRDCFCFLGGEQVRLAIAGDSIGAALLVEEGRELTGMERSWYKTVEDLFDFIEETRAMSPASLEVEYDAEYGYPRVISVDYSLEMADDEIRYRSAGLLPE